MLKIRRGLEYIYQLMSPRREEGSTIIREGRNNPGEHTPTTLPVEHIELLNPSTITTPQPLISVISGFASNGAREVDLVNALNAPVRTQRNAELRFVNGKYWAQCGRTHRGLRQINLGRKSSINLI